MIHAVDPGVRRRLRRRLRVGVALTLLATGVASAQASGSRSNPASASGASGCPAYGVVDTRGSGETVMRPSLPGGPVLRELRLRHPGTRVAIFYNPYPAVGLPDSLKLSEWRQVLNALGAGAHIGPVGAYNASVVDGGNWLRSFIPQQIRQCPSTKLVLVGYSQGAQATGDVYQHYLSAHDRSHIKAVLLFGDPYFNPKDGHADRGTYSHSRAGSLGIRPLFQGNEPVESDCHTHDPICNLWKTSLSRSSTLGLAEAIYGIVAWGFTQHENYQSDATAEASTL